MTFSAKHGAADLRLKRNAIMLAAVVADDLKSLRSLVAVACFFCAAFRTPLRSRHVTLVKHLLLFLSEQENFLTLNARCFYVRHMGVSLG